MVCPEFISANQGCMGRCHAGVFMVSAAGSIRQRNAVSRAHLHELGAHGDQRPPILLHFRCFHLRNVVEALPAVHAEQVAAHAERLAQRIRHHPVPCAKMKRQVTEVAKQTEKKACQNPLHDGSCVTKESCLLRKLYPWPSAGAWPQAATPIPVAHSPNI